MRVSVRGRVWVVVGDGVNARMRGRGKVDFRVTVGSAFGLFGDGNGGPSYVCLVGRFPLFS